MGFGSYDESERQDRTVDADDEDDEAVNLHEDDHEGEMSFEPGASTEELLERLGDQD